MNGKGRRVADKKQICAKLDPLLCKFKHQNLGKSRSEKTKKKVWYSMYFTRGKRKEDEWRMKGKKRQISILHYKSNQKSGKKKLEKTNNKVGYLAYYTKGKQMEDERKTKQYINV